MGVNCTKHAGGLGEDEFMAVSTGAVCGGRQWSLDLTHFQVIGMSARHKPCPRTVALTSPFIISLFDANTLIIPDQHGSSTFTNLASVVKNTSST